MGVSADSTEITTFYCSTLAAPVNENLDPPATQVTISSSPTLTNSLAYFIERALFICREVMIFLGSQPARLIFLSDCVSFQLFHFWLIFGYAFSRCASLSLQPPPPPPSSSPPTLSPFPSSFLRHSSPPQPTYRLNPSPPIPSHQIACAHKKTKNINLISILLSFLIAFYR